jgi:hypothetical protein
MAKNFIFYDQATVFRTTGSRAGEQLITSVKYGKEFLMNEREFKLVHQKEEKKSDSVSCYFKIGSSQRPTENAKITLA